MAGSEAKERDRDRQGKVVACGLVWGRLGRVRRTVQGTKSTFADLAAIMVDIFMNLMSTRTTRQIKIAD